MPTTPHASPSRCWRDCTTSCAGKAGTAIPEVDAEILEARLTQATRTWDDDLADALLEQLGEADAVALLRKYSDAFPEAYKEDFPARLAVSDIRRMEALQPDGPLGMNLYEPPGAELGELRFKIYRVGTEISLSEVLPYLQRMGVEVLDERPYEVDLADGTQGLALRLRPLPPRGGNRSGHHATPKSSRSSSRTPSVRCGRAARSPTASTP